MTASLGMHQSSVWFLGPSGRHLFAVVEAETTGSTHAASQQQLTSHTYAVRSQMQLAVRFLGPAASPEPGTTLQGMG